MRHHPAPAEMLDATATTAVRRVVAGRYGVVGGVLLALLLSTTAAVAQTAPTEGADPARRVTGRAVAAKPGVARVGAGTGLRGSLGATPAPQVAETPPADAAVSPTAADTLYEAEPGLLEPIGRPGAGGRPATTAAGATTRPAGVGAGRIDPVTGRPTKPEGEVGRTGSGPMVRVGPVKGGPTTPEAAIQPRPRDGLADKRDEATNDDEDYAPLGLRTGGFTWLPALETSSGWSSNVASKAGGASGLTWRVAPELIGRSDWSRHSLQVELRGAYLGNATDHDYDKPSFQGGLRGRIDLGDETTVDVRGGWSHDRQSASSADNPANTVVPATVESKTASLGITRDVGLLALTLRGDVERSDYSGGTTASGASLGSEIQNNTRFVGALRATLGSKGTFRPFVEVQGSKRDYDDAIVAGSPRDSTGGAVKVGVLTDFGPKLRGEVSTGWGVERPDKGTLPDMSGWLFDASLVWSPLRPTSVRLDARTSFEATTLATATGAMVRSVGVGVDHALRPDLLASAGVSVTDKRYIGSALHEDTLVLSSGLTYKIDRNIHTFVKGSLTRFSSSTGASDYDAATVMVGVRLQR